MSDVYYGPTANYYAKPSPPSATPSWGADAVVMLANAVAVGVIREYTPATTLDPAKGWVLFRRIGASPAATDEIVSAIPPDTLSEIKAKTDKIGTASAFTSDPVSIAGQITDPIIIGDDYVAALGRAFTWTVPKLDGAAAEDATCKFGIKNAAGNGFLVTGTVTVVDADNWQISFDVPRATLLPLPKGAYDWSAEIRDAAGLQVTRVRNAEGIYRVQLVAKQTG